MKTADDAKRSRRRESTARTMRENETKKMEDKRTNVGMMKKRVKARG